jgi:thymidine kinase
MIHEQIGELTVIVGSMFSGKSTELKRQGKRHTIAGKKVMYFKPDIDDRYDGGKGLIFTHDGEFVEARKIPPKGVHVFLDTLEEGDVDVVCIDEVQFFDEEIINSIQDLMLNLECDVIVAGLDMDSEGKPFGVVPKLLAIADHILKVKAVCQECGHDAYISHAIFEKTSQIVVGEKDKYVPLCKSCHKKHGGNFYYSSEDTYF